MNLSGTPLADAAFWAGEHWALLVLAVALVAAAAWDVLTGKIPNAITYPAILIGLVGHSLTGGLVGQPGRGGLGLDGAAAGFALGFLPLLAAYAAGGIGGGDAKMMGAVGALAGWKFTLVSMFWAFAAALVLSVITMVRRRIVRRTLARVGRFVLLALLPGKKVDPSSPDSPRIPFGLAVCIGAAVTLIDAFFKGPLTRTLIGV